MAVIMGAGALLVAAAAVILGPGLAAGLVLGRDLAAEADDPVPGLRVRQRPEASERAPV